MHAKPVNVVLAAAVPVGASIGACVPAALGGRFPVGEAQMAAAIAVFAITGAIVAATRPGHRVGVLLVVGAAGWAFGDLLINLAVYGAVRHPGSVPAAGVYGAVGEALRAGGWLVLVGVVPLYFPDGKTDNRLSRIGVRCAVAGLGLLAFGAIFPPKSNDEQLVGAVNPIALPADLAWLTDAASLLGVIAFVIAIALAIANLVGQWRRGSPLLRQRVLAFGAAAVPALIVVVLIPVLSPPQVVFVLAALPFPVGITLAVLQRRLYDVDRIINRTVTYALLSASVVALYVLVVTGVGVAMHSAGADWLGWVGAAVVALSFTPLRQAMQVGVNRMTYGGWHDPYSVVSALGDRLERAGDPHRTLADAVAELRAILRLRYLEVVEGEGPGDEPMVSVGTSSTVEERVEVELPSPDGPVGWLRYDAGRTLRERDRALLAQVARQLGAALHRSRLAEALLLARERLVIAREEERRRLRRDLHDGLGPVLAALCLKVDAARNVLADGGGGTEVDERLSELRGDITQAVVDVRRIVVGLRPPALDELGLTEALRQLAAGLSSDVLAVDFECVNDGTVTLPAAVEVAAYRIAQEAMTNAARHSGAARCTLRLDIDASEVRVQVTDDGTGGVAPHAGGLGLTGMRERAEEIGGRLVVQALAGRGTSVAAVLPLQYGRAT